MDWIHAPRRTATASFRCALWLASVSSATLSAQVTWGTSTGFGTGVAILEDLDGDGLREFAVADPGDGATRAGTVWILSPTSSAPLLTIADPTGDPTGEFGHCLLNVGDLDGDGTADFAVGNPGFQAGVGRVLIYSGAHLATPRLLWAPISSTFGAITARFGTSLVMVGDVNGNFVQDLAVGAPGARAVSIHDGNLGPSLYTLTESRTSFGTVLARVGQGDLAVGAPDHSAGLGAPFAGYFARYRLRAGSGLRRYGFTRRIAGERLGAAIADVGDVTGDGESDLAVAAWGHIPFGSSQQDGAVFLYDSSTSLEIAQHTNPQSLLLGLSLVPTGDLDGDGVTDLAAQDGSPSASIHLISGRSMAPLGVLSDPSAQGGFDGGLAAGPDLDGQGSFDLLLGSPRAVGAPGQLGRVLVASNAQTRRWLAGCRQGAGRAPDLGAMGRPVLGTWFAVQIEGRSATPGSIGILGLSARASQSLPYGTGNCALHLDLASLTTWNTWTVNPTQPRLETIPIANLPALTDAQAMMQAFVFDIGPGVLDASNAQLLRLGR